MLPRTRRHLAGPPFALPAVLDRVAEAWWRARPRSRMLGAIALALLLVAAGVAHAASSPDGPPARVLVATRDLNPGDRLSADDVRARSWPSRLVPDGATTDAGGTVTAPLPRGAVVTDLHLGDAGIAASVPEGLVAVAVPAELLPSLATGTRLDLVAATTDGSGVHLTSGATVVHQDADALWVAVEPDAAVAVSAAVATANISAVVLPP